MSTLKEDLAELQDTLPQLREDAARVTAEAHALVDAAAALLQEIHQAHDELQTLLAQAQDALPTLKLEIETLEKHLDESAAAVQQAWAQAHEALDASAQTLHTSGGQLKPKPGEVQGALSRAGGELDAAATEGGATVARLGAAAHDGATRMHAAAAAALAEATALLAQVEHAQSEAHDGERALFELIEKEATTRQQDAAHFAEQLAQRRKDHETSVEDPLEILGNVLTGVEKDWEDQLHEKATGPITTTAETVRAALDELARDAGQHENTVRENATAQGAAIDALEQEANHLPDGIHQIKEAMEKIRPQ